MIYDLVKMGLLLAVPVGIGLFMFVVIHLLYSENKICNRVGAVGMAVLLFLFIALLIASFVGAALNGKTKSQIIAERVVDEIAERESQQTVQHVERTVELESVTYVSDSSDPGFGMYTVLDKDGNSLCYSTRQADFEVVSMDGGAPYLEILSVVKEDSSGKQATGKVTRLYCSSQEVSG